MILPNILNASGLDSEARAALEVLVSIQAKVTSRNRNLVKYYEGDIKRKPLGIDVVPPTVNLDTACGWPAKAVTAVSERSRLDGFVFDKGNGDEGLEKVMRENNLIPTYNRFTPSELVHGCMFASVGRSALTGETYVRFHTAETAAATWSDSEGCIDSGYVIADMARTSYSPRDAVPVLVNLHLPGRVVELSRTGGSSWRAGSADTPLDRPMMESFAFRPTGMKPFGQTRITKAVMAITDDVMRTLEYMAVSAACYAHPKQYLLNLSDEQYDAISKDKWGNVMNAILLSTESDEGGKVEYGQLPATSPQPYIDTLRLYATMFSGETGVPVNSLGIIQDNPSSADAINASREDICIAAEDLNRENGASLRNIALMAMAVEGDCDISKLTDEQKSVRAHFKEPQFTSKTANAQAALSLAEADPDFVNTPVFYELQNFDKGDINRIERAKRGAVALKAAANMAAARREASSGESNEQDDVRVSKGA